MFNKDRTKIIDGESIGRAGTAIKVGIISALKGVNEIEAEIVELVRQTMSNALKASGTTVAGRDRYDQRCR